VLRTELLPASNARAQHLQPIPEECEGVPANVSHIDASHDVVTPTPDDVPTAILARKANSPLAISITNIPLTLAMLRSIPLVTPFHTLTRIHKNFSFRFTFLFLAVIRELVWNSRAVSNNQDNELTELYTLLLFNLPQLLLRDSTHLVYPDSQNDKLSHKLFLTKRFEQAENGNWKQLLLDYQQDLLLAPDQLLQQSPEKAPDESTM